MTVKPASVEPETAPDGEPPAEGKPHSTWFRAAREIVIIVVIALVASALLRAFVVQAFYVPTGSMLPTIQLNDKILVSRIGSVHRGEVVVFKDPGGWIPPEEKSPPPGPIHAFFEWIGVLPQTGDNHLVKRVIGLPGDHVVCCTKAGQIKINGKAIDESQYLFQGDQRADDQSYNVVVPAGHMFVLGDHRYDSADSSYHLPSQGAFVPEDLVTGRAVAIIWPLGQMRILHIPSDFQGIPPGESPAPAEGVVKTVKPPGTTHPHKTKHQKHHGH